MYCQLAFLLHSFPKFCSKWHLPFILRCHLICLIKNSIYHLGNSLISFSYIYKLAYTYSIPFFCPPTFLEVSGFLSDLALWVTSPWITSWYLKTLSWLLSIMTKYFPFYKVVNQSIPLSICFYLLFLKAKIVMFLAFVTSTSLLHIHCLHPSP